MYKHSTQIRVRYGETDQMGYLYYGYYAWYYEVGRVETIRSLGISYKELEESGVLLPVISLQSKYLRPAKYDDFLTVYTTITHLPKKSFIHFENEIENEAGELINTAKISLVFINATTRKKCLPPDDFIEKLNPYFE